MRFVLSLLMNSSVRLYLADLALDARMLGGRTKQVFIGIG